MSAIMPIDTTMDYTCQEGRVGYLGGKRYVQQDGGWEHMIIVEAALPERVPSPDCLDKCDGMNGWKNGHQYYWMLDSDQWTHSFCKVCS